MGSLMRFSELFRLGENSAQFDFVDVCLDRDIQLFMDPYSLVTTKTAWCQDAHELAYGYFQKVLDTLRSGAREKAKHLLCLHEDNRTRTGYSQNEPHGNALGDTKADAFLEALLTSEAFKSGQIHDIEDASLFVDGIGYDVISDMVINVLREKLAIYTQEQCTLWQLPMEREETLVVWRSDGHWTTVTMSLPTDGKSAILLLPRALVRKDLSLQSDRYLQDVMNERDRGSREAARALEQLVQNVPLKKNRKIDRKEFRLRLRDKGSIKDAVTKITSANPGALREYKDRARTKRYILSAADIEQFQPERRDLNPDELIERIMAENKEAAKNAPDNPFAFDLAVQGAILACLHPYLQYPRVIQKRKLTGVLMANVGTEGFLWSVAKRDVRDKFSNAIILTTPKQIDDAWLTEFKALRVFEDSGANLIVGVASSLNKSVLSQRKKLARKSHVALFTTAELADVSRTDAGPDVALAELGSLIGF
jgi:hypothetical protein